MDQMGSHIQIPNADSWDDKVKQKKNFWITGEKIKSLYRVNGLMIGSSSVVCRSGEGAIYESTSEWLVKTGSLTCSSINNLTILGAIKIWLFGYSKKKKKKDLVIHLLFFMFRLNSFYKNAYQLPLSFGWFSQRLTILSFSYKFRNRVIKLWILLFTKITYYSFNDF